MGKLLLVILVLGALVYLAFWLLEKRRAGRSSPPGPGGRSVPRSGGPSPRSPRPRTIAPDDDDAFLRDLDRRRRDRHADGDG